MCPEQSKRIFTKVPGNIMKELSEAYVIDPQHSGHDFGFLAYNMGPDAEVWDGDRTKAGKVYVQPSVGYQRGIFKKHLLKKLTGS